MTDCVVFLFLVEQTFCFLLIFSRDLDFFKFGILWLLQYSLTLQNQQLNTFFVAKNQNAVF